MRKFESLAGQRGVLAAAAMAGAVFAVLLAQRVVSNVGYTVLGTASGSLPSEYWGMVWGSSFSSLVIIDLPLVVGTFLSMWLLAPIAAELRLGAVVGRAVIATAVGIFLAAFTVGASQLVGVFSGVGSVFGNSFPEFPWARIFQAVTYGAQGSFGVFIQQIPLVILVSVFLWLWLQKHPVVHSVFATPDEV